MKDSNQPKKGNKQRLQRKSKYSSNKDEMVKDNENANLKNVSKYGDPNWYFLNRDLAEQASRFSFKPFIGQGKATGNAKLATICTFGLNPFIGTYNANDVGYVPSVVMAARKLYARLSSKTGRTSSYAPQDVMTIILAMGEIISITSHLKRVLGLAFKYEYRNRDYPNAIISALGVNPDDLFKNLSVYWTKLNTTLNQINKVPIPANISWLHKCGAIYSNVFKDSPDAMAQTYAFIPATTWKIDENTLEAGTVLSTISACYNVNYINSRTEIRTFDSWLTTLNDMISALLTSTSFNVIYSDILNMAAKDGTSLLHLDVVPLDYQIEPVYDTEFLLHVHNMNINKMKGNTTKGMSVNEILYATPLNDVYPDVDNNSLYQYPLFEIPGSGAITSIIGQHAMVVAENVVDFPYGDPDLTERIEATRYSTRYRPDFDKWAADDTDYCVSFAAAGDHYCVGMDVYADGEKWNIGTFQNTSIIASTVGTVAGWGALEKFDYHPFWYRFDTDGFIEYLYGDTNYFTNLGADWLLRINDLAFQGLFELRD